MSDSLRYARQVATSSRVHADLYIGERQFNSVTDLVQAAFEDGQKSVSTGVLQEWVTKLPLREQGTLLTAVRGCDDEAKVWSRTGVAYSPGRRLTAFIRWCFMNPADPREIDAEEGAFFMSTPPSPFKPSEFGHLPLHWYSHVMHALEIIGYRHPSSATQSIARTMYHDMVYALHLELEPYDKMVERLSEDRIAKGTVVS